LIGLDLQGDLNKTFTGNMMQDLNRTITNNVEFQKESMLDATYRKFNVMQDLSMTIKVQNNDPLNSTYGNLLNFTSGKQLKEQLAVEKTMNATYMNTTNMNMTKTYGFGDLPPATMSP